MPLTRTAAEGQAEDRGPVLEELTAERLPRLPPPPPVFFPGDVSRVHAFSEQRFDALCPRSTGLQTYPASPRHGRVVLRHGSTTRPESTGTVRGAAGVPPGTSLPIYPSALPKYAYISIYTYTYMKLRMLSVIALKIKYNNF